MLGISVTENRIICSFRYASLCIVACTYSLFSMKELRSPTLTLDFATSEESQPSSTQHPVTPVFASNRYSPTAPQMYNSDMSAVDPPAQLSFHSTKSSSADVAHKAPIFDTVTFPDIPIPPRPVTPSGRAKLKKKRSDGYESDGGYVSDAGKKKDKKNTSKNNAGVDVELDKKERAKEAKIRAKEEKLREKREKEEERKKKKSFLLASKASRKPDDDRLTGYETDGGSVFGKSLSKAKSKKVKSKTWGDTGDETDSGYRSSASTAPKRSKSRFFKLGTKQPKPDIPVEDLMPPPVAVSEPMSLPIAQRFATTLLPNGSDRKIDPGSLLISNTTSASSVIPSLSVSTSLITFTSPSASTSPTVDRPASTSTIPSAFPHSRSSASSPPVSMRNVSSIDRGSYDSGESGSSSSSNPKRRGIHFGNRDSANGGRTESFSTITTTSETLFPASTSPSHTVSKYPTIFIPPVYPASTSDNLTTVVGPRVGSLRPSASLSTLSPFVSPQQRSNPSSHNPSPIVSPSQEFPSPTAPLRLAQIRPRNPPTNGFGPRPTASPTQNGLSPTYALASRNQEWPSAKLRRSPTPSQLSIIPSSEYIVPSPRATPLPSPNVLAYYDIPPPSPPPTGPLPSVPQAVSTDSVSRGRPQQRDHGPFKASITRDYSLPSRLQASPTGIQRGKQTPFPVLPIAPVVSDSEVTSPEMERAASYEILHALATEPPSGDGQITHKESDSLAQPVDADWPYEEEEEDIQEVLERFDVSLHMSEERERAVGRSQPFEAIRRRLPNHVPSEYYDDDDDDDVRYSFSDDKTESSGEGISVYSRASLLDPDKSESARERFLQRVADMHSEGQAIPPIPRLPDSLLNKGAASSSGINRF